MRAALAAALPAGEHGLLLLLSQQLLLVVRVVRVASEEREQVAPRHAELRAHAVQLVRLRSTPTARFSGGHFCFCFHKVRK